MTSCENVPLLLTFLPMCYVDCHCIAILKNAYCNPVLCDIRSLSEGPHELSLSFVRRAQVAESCLLTCKNSESRSTGLFWCLCCLFWSVLVPLLFILFDVLILFDVFCDDDDIIGSFCAVLLCYPLMICSISSSAAS